MEEAQGDVRVWGIDFWSVGGSAPWVGGFVRLEVAAGRGRARYWAYLVGAEIGLVAVRDDELVLPRVATPAAVPPVIRAEGLWAELLCETAGEHWTIGLEAFGVRLDDPADALRGELGERLAIGFDLEWEIGAAPADVGVSGGGVARGAVLGEVLLGRDRIPFDGAGTFSETGTFSEEAGAPGWASTPGVTGTWGADGIPTAVAIDVGAGPTPVEVLGVVAIPLVEQARTGGLGTGAPVRALVRVLGRWTGDDGAAKVGWADLLEAR